MNADEDSNTLQLYLARAILLQNQKAEKQKARQKAVQDIMEEYNRERHPEFRSFIDKGLADQMEALAIRKTRRKLEEINMDETEMI